jgi:hypothetical protein
MRLCPVIRTYGSSISLLQFGLVMSGWRPLIKVFFCGVAFDRGCGHVFGLLMRVMTPRWPCCCPLIPCPNHVGALDGADKATGFGINPRYSHHLLVTIDSFAALGR